jgi:hypothetical protein
LLERAPAGRFNNQLTYVYAYAKHAIANCPQGQLCASASPRSYGASRRVVVQNDVHAAPALPASSRARRVALIVPAAFGLPAFALLDFSSLESTPPTSPLHCLPVRIAGSHGIFLQSTDRLYSVPVPKSKYRYWGRPMSRNILIFSDGTGQVGGYEFDEDRTNVYKLYRATRVAPDSCINPKDQAAFTTRGLVLAEASQDSFSLAVCGGFTTRSAKPRGWASRKTLSTATQP